ncbi:hypothetical protein BLNAU_14429 [Blattamonas nauphoetae]|uniref:Uncharacterized protein n=1 Tax=Blattamonas nauphoetae TaxID=2049346 RepID=A0ABQ9XDR3_9EUKA|nr:hypothetical protein BLNAU_15176 [Blattamonas nauphoetae]KAK2950623.1 hypothetical protein BLNAU_14429 [Blattamonas nauphoetae]
MKNEETGGAVVESAVTLDGLGVVITDGGKNECCSSVSVGLNAGLNQKQVDEKIILWIVNSSHFSLFDCEIHSDFNPTSPLPHTILIVPPPVDAEGRLIDISRISILPFTKYTIYFPVIPPSEPIRSSTSSILPFHFLPSTSTSSDPTHILLPKCEGVPLVLGESGSEQLLPVLLSSTSPDYCFAIQGLSLTNTTTVQASPSSPDGAGTLRVERLWLSLVDWNPNEFDCARGVELLLHSMFPLVFLIIVVDYSSRLASKVNQCSSYGGIYPS